MTWRPASTAADPSGSGTASYWLNHGSRALGHYRAAMSVEVVSAVAAIGAVIASVANVALSTAVLKRHDVQKWRRERLPQLIELFNEASFAYERTVFETDWSAVSHDASEPLGFAEYKRAAAAQDQLEVYATPTTIEAAREVMQIIGRIEMANRRLARDGRYNHESRDWSTYWAYAEASHRFLTAGREELGLEAPPMPPGLRRHIALEDGLAG